MTLTHVDRLILAELARRGAVRSIFALAVEVMLNYEHARARVAYLERAGLLTTRRLPNARGRPLLVTRAAELPHQPLLAWPSHDCDGRKAPRDA